MESRVDIIQSVPEYLKYIEGIPNLAATTNSLGCFTFYRGQATRIGDFLQVYTVRVCLMSRVYC